MIVIIEGPDGSGKTTLAKAIVEQTGATYLHSDAPTRHPLVAYTTDIQPGTDYVLDRWHLGEEVYGPIHRGGSGLTSEQFYAVEQYLDELGAVVVHCNAPLSTLVQRIAHRGEGVKGNVLRREANAFEKVMTRTWLPVMTSPAGMEVTAEEVIAYAREREPTCTAK